MSLLKVTEIWYEHLSMLVEKKTSVSTGEEGFGPLVPEPNEDEEGLGMSNVKL